MTQIPDYNGMDRTYLPAMHFVAVHGVNREEHHVPQLFGIYVEIFCNHFKAGETDNLEDTIDYSKIYHKVQEIVQGVHCNLLEHLAAKIAKAVLLDPQIVQVIVQVEKTAADMGDCKAPATVKITRRAEDYGL